LPKPDNFSGPAFISSLPTALSFKVFISLRAGAVSQRLPKNPIAKFHFGTLRRLHNLALQLRLPEQPLLSFVPGENKALSRYTCYTHATILAYLKTYYSPKINFGGKFLEIKVRLQTLRSIRIF
jgi:hypothetical protein